MKTLNNAISGEGLEKLRSLLGNKLISYSHEPFDPRFQPANDFLMRVGLTCSNGRFVLDNRVDWEDDWFCSPDYTPHLIFDKIDNQEQFTTFSGFSLSKFENYPVNETILDIILVQDEILVSKNKAPHENITSTEGVVLVTDKRQYAFYKENTWLDETVLEFKGHEVLSKIQPIEIHWNVFAKPYDGFITRKLIYLSANKEEVVSKALIIGNVVDD